MSTDPREFEHPIDGCNHPTPSQLPTVLGVGSLADPAVDAAADALQHWMLPGVSAHAVAIAALSAAAPFIAAQAKGEALREAAGEIGRYIDAGADGDASPQDTIKWLRARAATIENEA